MHEKNKSIYVRVSEQEKKKICRVAQRCGLSVSEYLRQRALGYEPRELPTEDLHLLLDYLRYLREDTPNYESKESVSLIISEIRKTLVLPGRGG